ncbi:hypothetical protein L6452_17194 [Arctium lappa]|uniref:Uncharacterized protein n=1 Tax=Arctium lappa TaxID=4217 RepID=A0ACB9C2N0_ARCLA|nr:hypothetical protein L6452_17194 [Arctium lappa]
MGDIMSLHHYFSQPVMDDSDPNHAYWSPLTTSDNAVNAPHPFKVEATSATPIGGLSHSTIFSALHAQSLSSTSRLHHKIFSSELKLLGSNKEKKSAFVAFGKRNLDSQKDNSAKTLECIRNGESFGSRRGEFYYKIVLLVAFSCLDGYWGYLFLSQLVSEYGNVYIFPIYIPKVDSDTLLIQFENKRQFYAFNFCDFGHFERTRVVSWHSHTFTRALIILSGTGKGGFLNLCGHRIGYWRRKFNGGLSEVFTSQRKKILSITTHTPPLSFSLSFIHRLNKIPCASGYGIFPNTDTQHNSRFTLPPDSPSPIPVPPPFTTAHR